MTVIATDGKVMAGDGITLAGWNVISLEAIKVRHLQNGAVFGCTGNATDKHKFAKWLNEGGDRPKLSDSFSALVLSRNGIEIWDGDFTPISVPAPQAIGCGGDFALAAMRCGKSPKAAVKLASNLSAGCGRKITVLAPE